MDRISVCMATYNGQRFIERQLNSILAQLGKDDELIISDDSSTDDTLKIIERFDDPRIRLYPFQKFRNAIFNFENAINKSSGDIIFLADQDDLWYEKKVEIMCQELQNYDLVVCNSTIIDENDNVIGNSYFELINSGPGLFKNFKSNTYLGCCIAFRRAIINKALPFPKDIPMHDIWFGFVADLFYKVKFIPQKLHAYRKHKGNLTDSSSGLSKYRPMQKIKFRINLIKYLPLLIFR